MDTKEAIRQNLLRLMGESGTKNVELARAVGVSKAAVTNWLNGNNSIDVNLVPKICEFFGVSVDEFLDVGTKKALSPEEHELIECFRAATKREKTALMTVARTYRDGGLALNGEDAQEGIA